MLFVVNRPRIRHQSIIFNICWLTVMTLETYCMPSFDDEKKYASKSKDDPYRLPT